MNDLWMDLLDEQLLLRISSEYAEMPGLQLTVGQAQRLFGLGERLCARLLDELVERRFLVRLSNGTYARLAEGSVDYGRVVRQAQVALKETA
jgi:hypothetical protein